MDHETALINAFILRERRARYTGMLSNPKKRTKILGKLHHLKDLDPRFIIEISPSDHYSDTIATLLMKRGAPEQCHVIGGTRELDGRNVQLVEALDEVVAWGYGTLISCIPGRLGFYEGEDLTIRYILERKIT
jgi:hypothetical protein